MGLQPALLRISQRAGIQVIPHSSRRTLAIRSLKAGMNLIHLQGLPQAHNLASPVDNMQA
jgi:hypothetical protein